MSSPMKMELTLESRDGEVRGNVTQSNGSYSVEFLSENGGDFYVYGVNRMTGSREAFGTEPTVQRAIATGFQVMAELVHTPFPGFTDSTDEEN
jgi:hypothetical protein